jgi:hypothetical protein
MKKAVRYFPVWIFIPIWALFVGVVLDRSVRLAHENHLFADHARRVAGLVQNKEQQAHSGGRGGTTYTYLVYYAYEVANIRAACEAQVQLSTWQELTIGGTVPIAYLPENPSDNRIDLPAETATTTWHADVGILVAILTFFLVGAGIWRQLSDNRLCARLRKEGERCQGIVISLVNVSTGKGGIQTYLTLEYTAQTGEKIQGKTGYLSSTQKASWTEGDSIQVYYDRIRADRFTVDLNHHRAELRS